MITVKQCLVATVILSLALDAAIVHSKSIEERKWIRMESQNFTILSVLSERRTRDLLKHLEAVQALFQTDETEQPKSLVPTVIYALGGSDDFRELGFDPDVYAGLFVASLRQNLVLIRETPRMDESEIIIHEYIHYLLHNTSRFPFPKWYQEGYAEYVSTSTLGGKYFSVGRINEGRVSWLREFDWLPMESIIDSSTFAAFEKDTDIDKFYAQSWLLTHYLYSQPGGQDNVVDSLKRYLQALQEGAGEIEAFESGFGITLSALHVELKNYVKNGEYQYTRFNAKPLLAGFAPVSTRLSKEEISIEIAELILALENDEPEPDAKLQAKARELFELALPNDATRARAEVGIARLMEMDGEAEAAEELITSGASLAAGEFYVQLDAAQFWLGRLHDEVHAPEYLASSAEPYLQRALAIDNSNPEVVYTTGLYMLAIGEIDKSLGLIQAAAARAPADQMLLWMLTMMLLEYNRPQDALVYANELLLFSHGSVEQAKMLLTLIEEIRKQR